MPGGKRETGKNLEHLHRRHAQRNAGYDTSIVREMNPDITM
jgi:hypothetical protein